MRINDIKPNRKNGALCCLIFLLLIGCSSSDEEIVLAEHKGATTPLMDITMQFGPRTFVGLSKENKKCFLFVIDGRQEGYSSGMRLEDVATLCKGAGCHNAINLDGGGSSTFVIKDETGGFTVLNKPSDGQLRPVINGLVVIKK